MVCVNDADSCVVLCGRRVAASRASGRWRKQQFSDGDRRRCPMSQLAPGVHTPLGYSQLEVQEMHPWSRMPKLLRSSAYLPRTLQFDIQCVERLLDRIDEGDAHKV